MQEENPTSQEDAVSSQSISGGKPKKPFYNQVWFIVSAAIVGLALLVVPLILLTGLAGGDGAKSSAGELFYSMMETAAQKSKVRYAYERTKPEVGDTSPLHVRSLAEYDYANKKYNTVYVSESIVAQAERCVDGKEYVNPDKKYPRSFAEAEEALRGRAEVRSSQSSSGICDFTKTRYQGNFTDGILPVGISAAQAKGMVDELRARDAIILKDEGTATYKGKKGRKVSFELNPEKTGSSYNADIFFYTFRDGTTGKVGGNGIDIDTSNAQFSVRLQQTFGVKGYYLIDEAAKLPIYSEIVTLGGGAPDFAPDTALSAYEFPDTFTMTPETQPPELGKPE